MRSPLRTLAALAVLAAATLASSPASAAHSFDLASKMPARLSVMFTMSWFGVGKADPQGDGGDPSYANWHWTDATCKLENDAATCAPFDGKQERSIASKRRPLAGIYSSSGRTKESLRRIDLMLSTLRRPCDEGARFDAFAVQLDSVKFTSRYPKNQQSETWDIAYRAVNAFLDRADAAKLKGAVAIACDATGYWHFGGTFGLTTQAARKAAFTDDIVDMVAMGEARPGAVHVDGKLVLYFYVDAALMTPSEWAGVFDDARARSGKDFYAVGTTLNPSFFQAFDALAPWVNLGIWDAATGATMRDRAAAWADAEHRQLFAEVSKFPGRAVFGGVAPGFDDYTQDWGKCTAREIPRDPAVLAGEIDHLIAKRKSGADVRGVIFQTWDDWTEGTEIEPDVSEGTAKLLQVRDVLGAMFGDADDPKGAAALDARWTSFGQARSCCFLDGSCADAGTPAIDPACGPPATGDGGSEGGPIVDGGADAATSDAILDDAAASTDSRATTDAGSNGAVADGGQGQASGCGCRTTQQSRPLAPAAAITASALALVLARRRRR